MDTNPLPRPFSGKPGTLCASARLTPTVPSPMDTDPRFPIGRFQFPDAVTPQQRAGWIDDIRHLPVRLEAVLNELSPEEIDTPYRAGGWTIRQVVHHVADSHMNAFMRFKLALTEEVPTIKPYHQDLWAASADSVTVPATISLQLIQALHARWTALLRSMEPEAFNRTFRHPEQGRILSLDQTLALYAWHGRHHTAHVEAVRDRSGG